MPIIREINSERWRISERKYYQKVGEWMLCCLETILLLIAFQQPWRFLVNCCLDSELMNWIESFMVCDLSIFLNTFTCAIDFPCKDDKISPHHFRGRPRIQVFLWVTNLSEQESGNKDLWSMWTILAERWSTVQKVFCAAKSHRLYLHWYMSCSFQTESSPNHNDRDDTVRQDFCYEIFLHGYVLFIFSLILETEQHQFDWIHWNACIEAGLNFFPSIVLVRSNIVQNKPLYHPTML